MTITAISTYRRDPALANASGLIAGTTGLTGQQGQPGQQGVQGNTGTAGRGITNVSTNSNNHLIVTYTDGSSIDIGPIAVPPPQGADGGTFTTSANPILLKRSTVSGQVPSSQVIGELAINAADRIGFVLDATGATRTINLTSDAEKVAATAPIGAAINTVGNKVLRFLPDRSTFSPSSVAGAGEYSLANAQTVAPAGLAVQGNGWDGGAFIVHEAVDCSTSNSGQTSTKVNGLTVVHALDQTLASGSSSFIRGGRQAGNFVLVKAVQTSSNNPDRHYVGLVGQALDVSGDGGTSASPAGRVFGLNGYGGVRANSYYENLTSGEHNTEYDPVATVDYHAGLQIVGILGKRGRTLDTGLAIGAIGPTYAFASGTANTRGFGNGITFTNKNGRSPVEPDSVLMTFDHSASVLRGFDFASVTFAAEIIRTPNMALSENALNLATTNAALVLGNTVSASSPRLNFASGGSGAGIYDASIIATGGTSGTAGNGALTVQAGIWSFGTAGVVVSLSTNATGYQAGRLYRDSNGFVKVVF